MELSQLRSFVAVAEAGGFSKAATLLVTTQPTLSRQVKALEQELGRPLFDRLGRRVELTAFGREALDEVRGILARVDALATSARREAGRATGVLRLGVADSVVFRRFPTILERFNREHPAVRVYVHEGSSPEILNWVREGKSDAGVCMLPELHPELCLRELWEDRFVGIVPPTHPLAGREVELADFAGERQIVIQPGTLSHQVLTACFHHAGLTLVPDMAFDDFQMIVDLVGAGMGVGIVSLHVADAALQRGDVARVDIPEIAPLRRSIGLATHADRLVDGALEAFVALASQERETEATA